MYKYVKELRQKTGEVWVVNGYDLQVSLCHFTNKGAFCQMGKEYFHMPSLPKPSPSHNNWGVGSNWAELVDSLTESLKLVDSSTSHSCSLTHHSHFCSFPLLLNSSVYGRFSGTQPYRNLGTSCVNMHIQKHLSPSGCLSIHTPTWFEIIGFDVWNRSSLNILSKTLPT